MIEHDGCKGCKYEKESADSKDCVGCVQNAIDKYSKMTNYDMIKNMSVEEMADSIDRMFNEDREDWKTIGCYNCIYKDTHHSIKGSSQYMCNDCCYENGLIEWLNSESEE